MKRSRWIIGFALISSTLFACSPASKCPTTRPNGSTPPGAITNELYHGNGELWTALWPDGMLTFSSEGPGEIRSDGSLAMKFPWWRAEGVNGPIEVRGKRLDAPGSGVEIELPDGYGDTGFQASILTFPSEGCWQVSAYAGDAELRFVVEVMRTD
ncbi:MAG: hypothetical protein PVI81_07285 [Anaerolineales bacterium]